MEDGARVFDYLWNDPMIFITENPFCGASVLHIKGPLRVPVGSELRRSVSTLLRRGGRRILVDLSRVSALDAGGVGELVDAYNTTVAARGVFRIVAAAPRVRELLDRAGLVDLLSDGARTWSAEAQPNGRVA